MSDNFELDIKVNTFKKGTTMADDKKPLMNKTADRMSISNFYLGDGAIQ